MTYQRDPDRPIDPANDDLVRRENIERRDSEIARRNAEATNGSGIVPLILTIALLAGLGYFAYSYFSPRGEHARTTEYTAPRTVTPTPTPAPPTTPQTK
jgi:hypothetical protein